MCTSCGKAELADSFKAAMPHALDYRTRGTSGPVSQDGIEKTGSNYHRDTPTLLICAVFTIAGG